MTNQRTQQKKIKNFFNSQPNKKNKIKNIYTSNNQNKKTYLKKQKGYKKQLFIYNTVNRLKNNKIKLLKKKPIYFFKKRNLKKFLKWQKRRQRKLLRKTYLVKRVNLFKKYIYYRYLSLQKQHILRLCFTRTNLFFVCTNLWGDVIFWFTSKQLGFRRHQLKSPYTIDAFKSLLYYYLKYHKVINFKIFLLGFNRHKKRLIRDLCYSRFRVNTIIRYIPVTFNGCKRKHKRRL